ncbi:hypothetical protein WA158_002001 [Blastocystis sp. Blastoise]
MNKTNQKDTCLSEIIDLLVEYSKESDELESIYRSCIFDISATKIRDDWYNYTQLSYDDSLKRKLFVEIVDDSCNSKDTFTLQKDSNGGVERHNEVHTVSFMDSDKDSSQESENTLRQRHTTENGIKSEIIENNKTISATNISHIKKTLKDPLYMFSILPPHSLRSAQLQFNLVIPKCVKIANIKTKLNSLINKYENLKLEIIDN